jgi:hypothetical protein
MTSPSLVGFAFEEVEPRDKRANQGINVTEQTKVLMRINMIRYDKERKMEA